MSVYNLIIMSGAAAAALISWGLVRNLMWIAAIISSYMVSVIYWDLGGENAEFIAGMCDAAVVGLIVWRAKYVWELWLALLFLTSMMVNMVYLTNNLLNANIVNHVLYSSLLEVINLAAVFLIGGIASFDKAGYINGLAFRPWMHFFGFVRPVYQRRSSRD